MWHVADYEKAAGFLNAMARDVDFSQIELPVEARGPHGGLESPFTIALMRRRAYRPSAE